MATTQGRINKKNQLDFIKWAGKSPLHIYENELLTAINSLDPEISTSEKLLERDPFKRLIAGLPRSYQGYRPPFLYANKK